MESNNIYLDMKQISELMQKLEKPFESLAEALADWERIYNCTNESKLKRLMVNQRRKTDFEKRRADIKNRCNAAAMIYTKQQRHKPPLYKAYRKGEYANGK